ncbi:acyl-CoA N-acyltransferase [Coprinopsis marcescibilis]|uniref:Acyl-CoA N-acyltransferase n=1 Tax=Coprinopsis marcescibilis TaxID=230819 RepID=A0A5C3L1R4_COPMA|nr:acyl-CoA N-acyltransferase [Coprinopsis marcescibilis]
MAEVALYTPDKRIRFTLPSPAEDEAIAKLRTDPINRRFLRFLPESVSAAQVAHFRETRSKDPRNLDFVISYLDDEGNYQFSGVCNVFLIDETHLWGDAGIWISSDRQGQGLTTPIMYLLLEHVIEQRGLHRISFQTGIDNAPMRGWLEKAAGIRNEGQFKNCWKEPAGGWLDVMSYGVTADEWVDRVKPTLQKKMKERGVGLPKEEA